MSGLGYIQYMDKNSGAIAISARRNVSEIKCLRHLKTNVTTCVG